MSKQSIDPLYTGEKAKLIAYINSKVHLPPEVLQEVVGAFDRKVFKKDQAVIRIGQHVTKYYFIATGGVRIVIELPEKEITAWIIFENNFISDLEALKSGQVSRAKFLTLEESEIYSIEASKMEEFYARFPLWQTFGRRMMEEAFLNIVNVLISFQTMDAEARYLQLLQQSDAIQRVPLKQLASYLGITPNSLSRIRKNIR